MNVSSITKMEIKFQVNTILHFGIKQNLLQLTYSCIEIPLLKFTCLEQVVLLQDNSVNLNKPLIIMFLICLDTRNSAPVAYYNLSKINQEFIDLDSLEKFFIPFYWSDFYLPTLKKLILRLLYDFMCYTNYCLTRVLMKNRL